MTRASTREPGEPDHLVITALHEPLAEVGTLVTLEGSFVPGIVVNFPSARAVPASLLGPNRATAVVPLGATDGLLTITGGGRSSAPVAFRVAPAPLRLQSFQDSERGSGETRQLPAMGVRRGAPVVMVVGTWLYVIGGGDGVHAIDSVERAPIRPDGTLGPFSVVEGLRTVTPRDSAAAVIIGGSLFILGGYENESLDNVERAEILGDGSLGPFTEVATLPAAHHSHGAAVIGRWVYLVGGNRPDVARGYITDDGMLEAFEDVPGVTLPGNRYRSSLALVRNTLYVLGGEERPRSVLRAPVRGDGSLGTFASAGKLPGSGRFAHWNLVLGDSLYLIGGRNLDSHFPSGIDRARIARDGTLGPFEPAGATMATPRGYFHASIVGNDVYVVGGENPGHLNGIERASILDGATS